MINYRKEGDDKNITLLLEGDLDVESTEVIDEEILPMLLSAKSVEINFSDVLFLDSTGIGLLLNLVQELKGKSIIVRLTNIRPEVYDVLNLLEVPEILGKEIFIVYRNE